MHRRPINLHAIEPKLAQGVDEPFTTRCSVRRSALARNDHPISAVGPMLAGQTAQGLPGADFEQDPSGVLEQCFKPISETDGLAKVIGPVSRISRLLRRNPGPTHV